MRNYQIYLVFFMVVAGIVAFLYFITPHRVDWQANFSSLSKQPYGTYMLVEELTHEFGEERVEQSRKETQFLLDSLSSLEASLYVLVDSRIDLEREEALALMDYVSAGNCALLAAESFAQSLLEDSLGLTTYRTNIDWWTVSAYDTSLVQLVMEGPLRQRQFYTSLLNVSMVFEPININYPMVVLGTNKWGEPNLVRLKFGEGYFFLSSAPALFSNYHLVHPGGIEYLAGLLSLVPQMPVYFDEFYHTGLMKRPNNMRAVLNNSSLKAGWFTMGGLFLVFLLFGGKRLSRPMPVVKPPENSSTDFVKAIGYLYFQQGQHDDLARKKMLYFTDMLRTKYRVNLKLKGRELVREVAIKCGVPTNLAESTLGTIERLAKSKAISETELIDLAKTFETFHRKATNT